MGHGFCCSQAVQIVFHAFFRAMFSYWVTGHHGHMGQKHSLTWVTSISYLVMVHSEASWHSSVGGDVVSLQVMGSTHL
jgi:hypothetical protein